METANAHIEKPNISIGSPLEILIAHHAKNGEQKKIEKIYEFLALKEKRDAGELHDVKRFSELKAEFSKEYLVHTDIQKYLEGKTPEEEILVVSLERLKEYLDEFEANPQKALRGAMNRANAMNGRRSNYAQSLEQSLNEGEKFWPEKGGEAQSLENNFPNIVQGALKSVQGVLNNAMRLGSAIKKPKNEKDESIAQEYTGSMLKIRHFLEKFNDREDLTLVDLMYYIEEHRDATTFRGSTADLYSTTEALMVGLTHTMPSQEKQRESVDVVQNCIDPRFLELTHNVKLASINAKHNLGLSKKDLDIFSTATGMISTVMRAYGVSEIDDRLKQYISNSGDHSLRVAITIAAQRDANIERFKKMHENGTLSAEQLERQIELAHQDATHNAKLACLHDTGEFLGELLGNNLVGKTEKEESILRRLRDALEDHIMNGVVSEELLFRLQHGPFKKRWKNETAKDYIRSSLNEESFDYSHPFYEGVFEIFERIQTNHDIVTQRSVGRINEEGRYENNDTVNNNDIRYTMQYAWSKITGHKFTSTDPADIAAHSRKLYRQKRAREDEISNNEVAIKTDAALPHNPDVTRINGELHTSLPFEVFMDERDIDYQNSLFKKFVDVTVENYKTLPPEEAKARQRQDEAQLHALCYDINHTAKKHARASDLNARTVDRAVRKSIAQGISMAQADLKERIGEDLKYLNTSFEVLSKTSYRFTSANTSNFLGGFFSDPEKPNQIFEPLQGLTRAFKKAAGAVVKEVVSPVFKFVSTPFQAMMLLDNAHVTEKDFKRLFQVTAALEFTGDAGLTATGFMEGGGGFDWKMLSMINPFITHSLAEPQRRAEAIEKCYGHVLHLYGDQIAEKYELQDAISLIKKREFLKKGEYYKKGSDITLSGEMAEEMFAYFKGTYTEGHSEISKKDAGKFEAAEQYMLYQIMSYELVKAQERSVQEGSSAHKAIWDEKIETLKSAIETLNGNHGFKIRAKHASEIRFGSIGLLGAFMSASDTGLPLPFTDGEWTTSAISGVNLALAGFSAAAASAGERMAKELPYNHKLRSAFEELPHFKSSEDGSVYIVKSTKKSVDAKTFTSLESAEQALNHTLKSPNIIKQCADCLTAIPVTAIRKLANRGISSAAFTNQNTAQTIDTIGVIGGAFQKASSVINGGAQVVSSVVSNMVFRRSGVLSMYMHEINEDLKAGKDPNFQVIKRRIRDQLKDRCNPEFLNAMNSVARCSQGTRWAVAGNYAENMIYNDSVSKVTHWYWDRKHGISSNALEKTL